MISDWLRFSYHGKEIFKSEFENWFSISPLIPPDIQMRYPLYSSLHSPFPALYYPHSISPEDSFLSYNLSFNVNIQFAQMMNVFIPRNLILYSSAESDVPSPFAFFLDIESLKRGEAPTFTRLPSEIVNHLIFYSKTVLIGLRYMRRGPPSDRFPQGELIFQELGRENVERYLDFAGRKFWQRLEWTAL